MQAVWMTRDVAQRYRQVMTRASQPTRLPADVYDSAVAASLVTSRTVPQQIAHWARIGRELEMSPHVNHRAIAQVLVGTGSYDVLGEHEQASHAYEAARIAEKQRRDKLAAEESFISETVFSHPSKVQLVSDAADARFLVHLHVVLVPVDLTVQRVLERVRRGGHAVPEQKIRDHYERLWEHIGAAIRIVDAAEVLDNGSARHPFHPCAMCRHGALIGNPSWPRWTPDVLRAT